MARSLSRSSACCRKNRQVAPTAITAASPRTPGRDHGRAGPPPAPRRGAGAHQHVDEIVKPVAEAGEPVLAAVHGLDRGPVLLQEAEDLMAGQHDPDVTVEQ